MPAESIYPFLEDWDAHKLGFIDRRGSIIIKPLYDGVSFFGLCDSEHHMPQFPSVWESLIAVQQGDCWGFIDPSGKIRIQTKFSNCGCFISGIAAVQNEPNGKWGFIDQDGHWIVTPKFDRPSSFENGIACVQVDGLWGSVDTEGGYIIKPTFEVLDVFQEELAAAKLNGRYGYVDRYGEFFVSPQFEYAGGFSEGLAVVGDCSGMRGYIDHKGTYVIKPSFRFAERFSEQLAAASGDSPNSLGFIDRCGRFVIPPIFEEAGNFYGGRTRIQRKNGLYGMLSKSGAYALPCEFSWLNPYFHEEYVFGVCEGNRGFFDLDGELRIAVSDGKPYPFYNGLAAIELENGIGYLDKMGKYVFRPA